VIHRAIRWHLEFSVGWPLVSSFSRLSVGSRPGYLRQSRLASIYGHNARPIRALIMASATPTGSLRGDSPCIPEARGAGPPQAEALAAPGATRCRTLYGLRLSKEYKCCARGKARPSPWALRRLEATPFMRGEGRADGQDKTQVGAMCYQSDIIQVTWQPGSVVSCDDLIPPR